MKRDDVVKAIANRFRDEDRPDNEVDIRTWNLEDDLDDYSQVFEKAVVNCANKALKIALEEDADVALEGTTASSLDLYIVTPLGAYDDCDHGPRWKVNFMKMVRLEIEMIEMFSHEGDFGKKLLAMRDAMKTLVAEMDEIILKSKTPA
jgi:hypothetical protein